MEVLVSSKAQRRAEGQSRRKRMGRSAHGEWKRKKGARSAFEVLREASRDRVPHLLKLKYERMAASPFGYLRGAVPVMAYDLGGEPHTGIVCQLCGDAHVLNLGAFAAPDGRMVFDINDFDESIAGPFEWDVKRMATSIHLAARESNEGEGDCREAVRVFLHRYAKCMEMFAAMPIVDIARYQIHRQAELEAMQTVFAKAERSTPLHLRDSLTELVNARGPKKAVQGKKGDRNGEEAGARVFRKEPPVLTRLAEAEAAPVLDSLVPYLKSLQPERRHLLSRYRPVDVAFKVVGTGSVGLRAYCVYMEGNGPDDPLFLQIKQEVASAWAPYVKEAKAATDGAKSEGQRVVNGQRAMQVQSDPFLGHTQVEGRDYLVRQLNDHKGSVDLGALDREALAHYADLCGELLARGHARSGDPDALAGYLGGGGRFEKAIAAFAKEYADQTEEDWKQLKKLLRSQRA